MPVLRLFAAAREAAGVARAELDGATVGAILEQAEDRFGERFSGVLAHSRVWVNGQPAQADTVVQGHDVIAVLPPVSGGSDVDQVWGRQATATATAATALADPVPEEMPAAVVLLERDRDDVPDPVPEPALVETSTGYPDDWPAETTAYKPGWPDDGDVIVDEPDWLVDDDPHPRPVSPPADQLAFHPPAAHDLAYDELVSEDGWSGWSTNTGSYEAIAPADPAPSPLLAPILPPLATPRGGGVGFFAPAEPAAPAERPTATIADPAPPQQDQGDAPASRSPTPAPRGRVRQAFNRLAVVHDSKGPHGRLGLLWAIAAVGAAIGGPESLAGWLGLTAFVGACQASAARLGKGHGVLTGVSAITAIALPAAALVGVEAVAAGVGGAAVLAFAAALFFSRGSATIDGTVTFGIGVSLGLAAAAPVLLRPEYIEASFLLLAYAATYDAGAYLVGTGASSVWEGPVAGVAALIPVVILSAVLLVPPFDPGSPIALGVLAAVLAPLGPLVGSALVGGGEAHAPGLRRLDSLVVLGPIWAAAAVAFIS
jgi:molybdopterin synthase sulfur carrier subunit